MNRKAHLVVGFLVVALFVIITHLLLGWFNADIKTGILLICITYIFCLLPDIDHKMSSITWMFLGIGIIGIVIGLINTFYRFSSMLNYIMIPSAILLVVTFISAKYIKHRGIIHTIRIGIIFSGLIYFIIPEWRMCLVGLIAYQSHLMADGYRLKI